MKLCGSWAFFGIAFLWDWSENWYIYLQYFLDYLPIYIFTEFLVEFLVLYNRSLLVICFVYLLFSPWVMSDFFWPNGLQHAKFLCPLLSAGVCSNSCPLNQWCYLTISLSVAPFFFCLQPFPASGSFPMSRLFTLCVQSNGASASASVLPMNTQDWFPLGLTGLIL